MTSPPAARTRAAAPDVALQSAPVTGARDDSGRGGHRPAGLRSHPLRADAQANLHRVLVGARQAITQIGLQASYHDIARLAEVGVGTVYRRFPDRQQLLEAVLLDILEELDGLATDASTAGDPWAGFCVFFAALAHRFRDNVGLSESLDDHGGERVAGARRRLLEHIGQLTQRAQRGGNLRPDVSLPDILALVASLPRGERCALDIPVTPAVIDRCVMVMLDGLVDRAK